jgi:lysophospholipase L1-like esterase
VRAAAAAYARDVHIVDFTALFTPGDKFRESMSVGGRDELVRQADGIHLNETGGEVAADAIMARMAQDYSNLPSR